MLPERAFIAGVFAVIVLSQRVKIVALIPDIFHALVARSVGQKAAHLAR